MHHKGRTSWGSWEDEMKSMYLYVPLYLALCTVDVNCLCPPSVCTIGLILSPLEVLDSSKNLYLGTTFPSPPLLLPWPCHLLGRPTWSCGSAPGRCHQPCRSRKPRGPWLCRAYRPPRPWPWPPRRAARRTGPSSAASSGRPTPSAHEKGKGSGWSQGHPSQCPPLLHASWLSFFLASREHHPVILGKKHRDGVRNESTQFSK